MVGEQLHVMVMTESYSSHAATSCWWDSSQILPGCMWLNDDMLTWVQLSDNRQRHRGRATHHSESPVGKCNGYGA